MSKQKKRVKLKVGDVFTVPLTEQEVGFGQIIYMEASFLFMAVFYDCKSDKKSMPDLNNIVSSKVILMGNTFDSLINLSSTWTVIGNDTSTINNHVMPVYRLGHPDGDIFIMNYKREIIRSCTKEEYDLLNFKSDASPMLFEKGLKSFYKILELSDVYEKLTIEYFLKGTGEIKI